VKKNAKGGMKKLQLSRETLAHLGGAALARAAGGSGDDSWSVAVPCPTDVTNCHPCKPPKI
jgi:hypothetical protein